MANGLYNVADNVDTVFSSDIDQLVDALNGINDIGTITLYAPISPPSAPTVNVSATAGVLTGTYSYRVAFVTGYWKGIIGSGTLIARGNTSGGTISNSVSPSAKQVTITTINTGPVGTVARILYRTKAGGGTYYQVAQINDNTTTTYTDNIADASITVVMPVSNTTGTILSGYATLASPTFTGVPLVPTASADTNTQQIASTAFMLGQASSVAPIMDGTATIGTSFRYAREGHIHPTDTSRAPINNPAFTGTGITLPADATSTMQAVTKQQMDAQIAIAKNYAP